MTAPWTGPDRRALLSASRRADENKLVDRRLQDEVDRLRAQRAELISCLRDVMSWVPGRQAWHTDEPIKAVERARLAIKNAEAP